MTCPQCGARHNARSEAYLPDGNPTKADIAEWRETWGKS